LICRRQEKILSATCKKIQTTLKNHNPSDIIHAFDEASSKASTQKKETMSISTSDPGNKSSETIKPRRKMATSDPDKAKKAHSVAEKLFDQEKSSTVSDDKTPSDSLNLSHSIHKKQ